MSSLFIPHGKISPTLSLVPNLTWTTKQMSLSARVARCGSWWHGSSGVRLEGKTLTAAQQPGWLDTAGTACDKLRHSSRPVGVTVFLHRPPPGDFPLPMPMGFCTFRHAVCWSSSLERNPILWVGWGLMSKKAQIKNCSWLKVPLKNFPLILFSLGYLTPETLAENKVTDYNEIISFKFFKYWFLWQIFLFVRNRPQG